MLKFNLKYFLITVFLLIVEILIATIFKHLFFIRAYFGDVLATMVLYTLILSFFDIKNKLKLTIGVFIFSVFIEVLQYFKTADFLGFKERSIPHIMLGNSFSWIDILCYGVGCIAIYFIDKILVKKKSNFIIQ